ncbi:hypothetical protein T439DRAFT_359747 [Meredithblackwellia eburnea MCA 4105]
MSIGIWLLTTSNLLRPTLARALVIFDPNSQPILPQIVSPTYGDELRAGLNQIHTLHFSPSLTTTSKYYPDELPATLIDSSRILVARVMDVGSQGGLVAVEETDTRAQVWNATGADSPLGKRTPVPLGVVNELWTRVPTLQVSITVPVSGLYALCWEAAARSLSRSDGGEGMLAWDMDEVEEDGGCSGPFKIMRNTGEDSLESSDGKGFV